MERILVDAVGEACTIQVVKAARALGTVTGPCELEVRVDNDVAVQNLLRLAAGNRLPVQTVQLPGGVRAVIMTAEGPVEGPAVPEPAACDLPQPTARRYVVAVDTETMGRGDESLGRVLMKGFLFALSQFPEVPDTILFYNGGAHLTVEGSDALGDLRHLEERGTAVRTCGTCLDHYGLKDRLAVGSVTNMYEIAEILTSAEKVIKP